MYSIQYCSIFAQFTSTYATSHLSQISAKLHDSMLKTSFSVLMLLVKQQQWHAE